MFDEKLFYSLCEKYNVEMSSSATCPMIKNGTEVHAITEDDISRIFSPCQTYFEYPNDKMNTKTDPVFYVQDDYAIAC